MMRNVYLSVHLAATFFIVLLLGGIANSAGIIFFALITQPARQFLAWLSATIGLSIVLVALQPFLRSSNHVPFGASAIFGGSISSTSL